MPETVSTPWASSRLISASATAVIGKHPFSCRAATASASRGGPRNIYLRAKPAHQIHEFREAGCDHGLVVDRHPLFAGQSHDEKTHRDAVVEMSFHRCASAEPLAVGRA